MIDIRKDEALDVLYKLDSNSIDLIYIDPPFFTQKEQKTVSTGLSYSDNQWSTLSQYCIWLQEHLEQSWRILKDSGSIYVHIDYRVVANIKIKLDKIFGRENLINWIVWCYNSGGASKRSFAKKHDDILWYGKTSRYIFTEPREPYPRDYGGREGFHKDGRIMNDWWQIPIMSTTSKDRLGYPNQKPLSLLERIVKSSSLKNGNVLDYFAGTGTTGQACLNLNRNCILVDSNSKAVEIMKKRLEHQ